MILSHSASDGISVFRDISDVGSICFSHDPAVSRGCLINEAWWSRAVCPCPDPSVCFQACISTWWRLRLPLSAFTGLMLKVKGWVTSVCAVNNTHSLQIDLPFSASFTSAERVCKYCHWSDNCLICANWVIVQFTCNKMLINPPAVAPTASLFFLSYLQCFTLNNYFSLKHAGQISPLGFLGVQTPKILEKNGSCIDTQAHRHTSDTRWRYNKATCILDHNFGTLSFRNKFLFSLRILESISCWMHF